MRRTKVKQSILKVRAIYQQAEIQLMSRTPSGLKSEKLLSQL